MRVLAAGVLLLLTSACADIEPQVGCLEGEAGTGTPCPPEAGAAEAGAAESGVDARVHDGSVDGGADGGSKPSDASKSEAGADALEVGAAD